MTAKRIKCIFCDEEKAETISSHQQLRTHWIRCTACGSNGRGHPTEFEAMAEWERIWDAIHEKVYGRMKCGS